MQLSELVRDWGGFERLVADLHNTGEVHVEHDVTLTGQAGVPRQIDVLITHTQGLYTQKIIVECKYWNTKIKRSQIDAMITQMHDLNASKGVFFTVKGCQSGAKQMAEQHGIDVFVLRNPTDEEWGAPGAVVDFYLQIISRTIKQYAFPNMTAYSTDPTITNQAWNIIMGAESVRSSTPTIKADGNPGKSLEELIDEITLNQLKSYITQNAVTFNEGAECTVHMVLPLSINFSSPLQVVIGPVHVSIPHMELELGIRIAQSRMVIDRRDNFVYALIVEDAVRKGKYYASRRSDASTSVIVPATSDPSRQADQTLQNGSIFHIYTDIWFNSEELSALTPIPWDELRGSTPPSQPTN